MTTHLLVLTNLPDQSSAETLATELVGLRLAACVNILAPCQSVYRWNQAVERTAEIPLLIKTTAAAYPSLEVALRAQHPYELPAIVAWPCSAALPEFAAWVAGEVAAG